MTIEEKNKKIEAIAKKYMSIEIPELKSMAIITMTAYEEGKKAGKEEVIQDLQRHRNK